MAAGDIADSTDWLSTSIPLLAPFESSLRCQVCKDLFNTPMITSCAHTFCSLCIRRCLENDGRCPTCREQDQPSKLRKNGTVQNIVDLFQEARSQALDVARSHKDLEEQLRAGASNGRKRKRIVDDDVDGASASQKSARQTRSQSKRAAQPATSQASYGSGDETDEDHQEVVDLTTRGSADDAAAEGDGLVPCPMCNTRMKEEAIWAHLDKCDGTAHNYPKTSRPTVPASKAQPRPPLPTHNIDRLPQPNFRLLKDTQLKKKMSDFGVPVWGDRQLLQRRYTEWVNLYNANADSTRPRTTRELLRDLDTWERSQGGRATLRDTKTKEKDFDGQAWARDNKDQFADLIAQARAMRKSAPSTDETNTTEGRGSDHPGPGAQAIDQQASGILQDVNSEVVRSTSATLTASADPVISEVLLNQPDHNEAAEPNSRVEITDIAHRTAGASIGQDMEQPQRQPDRGPATMQQLSSAPLQKRPMFTVPDAGFTDGDGIESGGG